MKKATYKLLSIAAACLLSGTTMSAFAQTEFAGSLDTVSISDATGTNKPPTANFNYTQNGNIFTFNASDSFDSDGSIVQYIWNFDDGVLPVKVSNEIETQYTTDESSKYFIVTLTIFDNKGGATVSTKKILNNKNCDSVVFSQVAKPDGSSSLAKYNNWRRVGVQWKTESVNACAVAFWMKAVGDISSNNYKVTVYKSDFSTIKAQSQLISGSEFIDESVKFSFSSSVTIDQGDYVVISLDNSTWNSSNYANVGRSIGTALNSIYSSTWDDSGTEQMPTDHDFYIVLYGN